jgi:hypothetical protein
MVRSVHSRLIPSIRVRTLLYISIAITPIIIANGIYIPPNLILSDVGSTASGNANNSQIAANAAVAA